jgi:hypothetical protein
VDSSSPRPSSPVSVTTSLRGADIAPTKRRLADEFSRLKHLYMTHGHLTDRNLQVRQKMYNISVAILGDLYGKAYDEIVALDDGTKLEMGTFHLNAWRDRYRGTSNASVPGFFEDSILEISRLMRRCKVDDLRELKEWTSEDDGEGYEDALAGGSLVD